MAKQFLAMLAVLSVLSVAQAQEVREVGFCAHRSYQAVGGFQRAQYVAIPWLAQYGDIDNRFDVTSDYWTQVRQGEQPAQVRFSGQLYLGNAPADQTYAYVATIFKNGQLSQPMSKASIAALATGDDRQVITITGWDIAQPGDWYFLALHSASDDVVLDGTPAHTWWAGTALVMEE